MNYNNRNLPLVIKTDVREKTSGVPTILEQKYGIATDCSILAIGDYILNKKFVIERKTAIDFAQSIIDGRLFQQAAMMKRKFNQSLVIIEGNLSALSVSSHIHPHAVCGALVSLCAVWQIPVLFSKDTDETALFLWLLANQNIKSSPLFSLRPGNRPKRLHQKRLYILESLPGVGPKIAMRLLDHFKSVAAVMTASEEELMKIKSLGQKKILKIKEILTQPIN